MNEKILLRKNYNLQRKYFYPKTNSLANWKKYIIPDYKSHVLGKNEVLDLV